MAPTNKFIKVLKKVRKEGHIKPDSPLDVIIEASSKPGVEENGIHSSEIKVDNGKVTLHGRVLSGESKE